MPEDRPASAGVRRTTTGWSRRIWGRCGRSPSPPSSPTRWPGWRSYGRPLRADDPLAPLARDMARALTLAGFTLHHCVQYHPLYRLGGVCLLPVARGHDPDGRGGVVVSWTTHNLLSLDWDRWREYQGAQGVMNRALAEVLDALGF